MAPAVKAQTTIKTPWTQISSEKISDFVGDRVIVARAADTPKVDFTTAPVWKNLEAVKNNEVYEIDNFKFWFTDPISVIGQINDLTDLFIERANDKKTK
ncbi:Iron(3+)-hydroxamate-binding protein FhuD precursor [compost metagenome]